MPRPVPVPYILNHYLHSFKFPLHTAARHGSTTLIKELVAAGHSPNGSEPLCYGTPLHVAIKCDQLESVLTLLLCGADTEAFTPNHFSIDTGHTGDNSLRVAVRWGRREIVKLLWDLGVKRDGLNESDAKELEGQEGRRLPGLLEIAAWEGHVDVVRDLLAWSDAWTDEETENAFVNGARVWEPEIVDALLLTRAFSQEILTNALEAAVQNGPRNYPRFLSPSYTTGDWMTSNSKKEARTIELLFAAGLLVDLNELLLQISFRPIEIETMKFLLKKGANVMTKERNGWTPLHIASRTFMGDLRLHKVNVEGIKILVEHGADVYAVDDEGCTPLHFLAARNGSVPMLKYCLENGAKPADGRLPRNEHGESLLHEVCAKFRPQMCEIIEALLDAGFDVNERTSTGWTPLICCIAVGPEFYQVSQVLLSRGADASAATDEGWTALHRLADNHLDEETVVSLAEDLIFRGADVSAFATVPRILSERRMCWGHEFNEMLDVQSEKRAGDVVARRTPLHGAADSRALGTIRVLLNHGADPLAMDSTGTIPAVLAAWSKPNGYESSNRTEVLKVLLRAAPMGFDMTNEQGLNVRNWVKKEGFLENWRLWW